MLKRYDKNRLLIGIGKAQHLMLDLGRKLVVEQVTGEPAEVATVVVELGQDSSQLCFPSTIRPRPYSLAENLAVVSPVKHCRHPGFLATRRMPLLPLPAATASLSSGRFRRSHPE